MRSRIDHDDMRIAFFTNEDFALSEEFRYIFANVAAAFRNVHVVAIRRSKARKKPFSLCVLHQKARRVLWRAQRFGVVHTLGVLTSFPLRLLIIRRNEQEINERIRALPRPPVELQPEKAIYVETVNGPDAVEAISKLEPDVVIQVKAGILRRQVFEIARIGTLNLHPGIAPLIKGQEPGYWALWDQKREWMGATLHYIDEGIDTGPVLAYAPIKPCYAGERYPSLYTLTTELGVKCLVEVLYRLERGDRWTISPPQGERVYRTIPSGWRLLLLEIRLAFHRARRHSCGILQP
jgi:folate-dependent phosphoribosylglycinamide formyltransferase PurN